VLYCGYVVLYGCCVVLYCCCTVLYGAKTWLNCGVALPIIISSCTLYASDVLSRIKTIVIQYLSSWSTDLQKFQYELFGTVWYLCIIGK
jgi:hypothetical protein